MHINRAISKYFAVFISLFNPLSLSQSNDPVGNIQNNCENNYLP